MAVPVARGVTLAGNTPGLRRLAWLTDARGLANRSEGLGWPGPVDKCEGFRWARLAQGLSIKVKGFIGGRAGPGPVDESEGLGAGPAQALSIKVRAWGPGRPRPCRQEARMPRLIQ